MIELKQPPAEFGRITAYLQEASRDREPMTAGQIRTYYDLLGDLPMHVLEAASRRVMMEHTYPTVPTAGAVRRAALELMRPEVVGPEAWRVVWQAVRRYGLDNYRLAVAEMPPAVARAVECFGWRVLCDAKDAELTQTRFLKVYAEIAGAERREAALPPTLRAGALQGGAVPRVALPAAVAGIVGSIGESVRESVSP
jgi:hypothetical protein